MHNRMHKNESCPPNITLVTLEPNSGLRHARLVKDVPFIQLVVLDDKGAPGTSKATTTTVAYKDTPPKVDPCQLETSWETGCSQAVQDCHTWEKDQDFLLQLRANSASRLIT